MLNCICENTHCINLGIKNEKSKMKNEKSKMKMLIFKFKILKVF